MLRNVIDATQKIALKGAKEGLSTSILFDFQPVISKTSVPLKERSI